MKQLLVMRTPFFALAVFVLTSLATHADVDALADATAITLAFDRRQSVTFKIRQKYNEGVDVHNRRQVIVLDAKVRLGSSTFTLPQSECASLQNVRFETVRLGSHGGKHPLSTKGFYLQFEMGLENERTFGELPKVQVHFQNRKFFGASLTRKTSPLSWETIPVPAARIEDR